MRNIFLLFVLIQLSISSEIFCQKRSSLEARVQYLEMSLDSLKRQVKFHPQIYDHEEIELNKLRSSLALELNRNFTYFAMFYEANPDTKDGKGYQRVFIFSGYQAVTSFNQSMNADQASYLKTIRQNLNGIKNTVLGSRTEPIKYSDDYTLYPNQLIINYYDNSSGGEPMITADTDSKSLKVRISGIMQEVGWQ